MLWKKFLDFVLKAGDVNKIIIKAVDDIKDFILKIVVKEDSGLFWNVLCHYILYA